MHAYSIAASECVIGDFPSAVRDMARGTGYLTRTTARIKQLAH